MFRPELKFVPVCKKDKGQIFDLYVHVGGLSSSAQLRRVS
jgi:hypothetical protein